MQKRDISSPEDIRLLVDTFYDRAKNEPTIGPVFMSHIADWETHLEKMYKFWGSILLGEHSYNGNPFGQHVPLKIDSQHFSAWLVLFTQTVNDLFEGEKAAEALERAENIGRIFDSKLRMIRTFNAIAEAEFAAQQEA